MFNSSHQMMEMFFSSYLKLDNLNWGIYTIYIVSQQIYLDSQLTVMDLLYLPRFGLNVGVLKVQLEQGWDSASCCLVGTVHPAVWAGQCILLSGRDSASCCLGGTVHPAVWTGQCILLSGRDSASCCLGDLGGPHIGLLKILLPYDSL